MFTLEIGGRPTAIMDSNEDEARQLFESEDFKTDMQRWMSDEQPIWDGQAEIRIRPSTEDETAQFEPEERPQHGDREDLPTVMFLIDAYDPDDIEED
jgi:hypothetical protein